MARRRADIDCDFSALVFFGHWRIAVLGSSAQQASFPIRIERYKRGGRRIITDRLVQTGVDKRDPCAGRFRPGANGVWTFDVLEGSALVGRRADSDRRR